jgi:hypothetical protein
MMQTRKRTLRGSPAVDAVVSTTYRATPQELLEDFQLLCNKKLSSLTELQHCVDGDNRRRRQRSYEGDRQQEDFSDKQDIEGILGLASVMSHTRQRRLKQKSVKKEAPLVPVTKTEDKPAAPPRQTGPMGYPKMLPPFVYFTGFPYAMHPPLSSSMPPQPNLGQPQRVQYPPQWAELYSQMLQAHMGNRHPQMTQLHPQQDPLPLQLTRPQMSELQPQTTQLKSQKPRPSEALQRAGLKRGSTHIAIAYFISSHQSKTEVSTNLKRLKSFEPLLS